jgi:translocator protein
MSNGTSSVIGVAALAGFLLLSFAAAATGILFPPGEWYAGLERPFYAPPNWLFGPVWTLLYIAMAVAAWLVWRKVGLIHAAIGWWLAQVVLNALWTPLFFGLESPGLALIEMTALWVVLLICVVRFRPISTPGFVLMLPYLAWVSFAWILNAGFWWLN